MQYTENSSPQRKYQIKLVKIRLTGIFGGLSIIILLLSLGPIRTIAQCGFCPDVFPGIPIIDSGIDICVIVALFATFAVLFKYRQNKIISVQGIIVCFIGIIILVVIRTIYLRTALGGPVYV